LGKGTKTVFAGRDPARLRRTGPLRFSVDGARGPNSLRSNMGRSPAPPPCDARLALRLGQSRATTTAGSLCLCSFLGWPCCLQTRRAPPMDGRRFPTEPWMASRKIPSRPTTPV